MKPKMIRIEGHNTYPVKDELKELGARWDKEDKAWYITEDKIEEANAIVAKAPPREPRKREEPTEPHSHKQRNLIHTRCPVCGTEWDIPINN